MAPDKLNAFWPYPLGEFDDEVKGVERTIGFPETLGAPLLKDHAALELPMMNPLQRDRGARCLLQGWLDLH